MANRVYIGVGSNDDPQANIRAGLRQLAAKTALITVSPVYETAAIGGGAPYWNLAVCIQTPHKPDALKQMLTDIENAIGRVRYDAAGNKSQVVALDFDILLYNDEQRTYGKRQIPHPEISRYAHVAVPLADIAADIQHPVTGEKISAIAARLRLDAAMQRRDDVVLVLR